MVEPCPDGGGEVFAAVYAQHAGRLVRWLTAVFGPRDAEDIAQETLLRLYVRPALVDALADPWPWLVVVARNVGRDMVRRNARSQSVDPDVLTELVDAAGRETMPPRDAETLARALGRLTPAHRRVIVLRDIEGRTVPDIAAMLGTTRNAANQRVFRARRNLVTAIAELHGGAVVVDPRPAPARRVRREQRRSRLRAGASAAGRRAGVSARSTS